MDPNTQRAEAERWLGIAAKLLTARDFLGSKTFAIRARESDPNNSVSDQILAVVDTVLAGEKRVNTSQQPDWYAVLQLPRLVRDPDLIATHYRRLVVLLNPDRNRLPFADYALQLVMDGWAVLSDPTKKWLFDNELALSLQRQSGSEPHQQQQQQQQPVRVDPVRVDPAAVAAAAAAAAASSQLNTFQFFQPQPQQPPPQPQQPTLQMWQQPTHQQSQFEFMPPPQPQPQPQPPPPPPPSSSPSGSVHQQQQHQLLPPQWQMRDPNPVKGGERNKGSMNGIGGGSSNKGPPPPPPQQQQQQQQQYQYQHQQQHQHQPQPAQAATVTTPTARARAMPPPPAPVSAPAPQPVPTPVAAPVTVAAVAAPVMERPSGVRTVVADGNVSKNNDNVNHSGNHVGNVVDGVGNETNDDGEGEQVESFWTACPYCFYIYEYQKMYQDCTLRCQNCRRGFHAVQIPNPPPIANDGGDRGGGGKNGKESSFCCWGFFPLGFSMAAWKKHHQAGGQNGSSNWVPFSPMFACPTGNGGGGNFQWFASDGNAAVGPKNVGRRNAAPRVYIDDDDEDYVDGSDSSDSDSSDTDWRRPGAYQKKRRHQRARTGVSTRGRPRKVDTPNQANQISVGGGVSVGGEDMEDGSSTQVVVGLVAGARSEASKTVASTVMRKQTRRSMKDMGRLDLNVEFNNEGDEHAHTVRAVNREEDGIENIGFFEGLDEFLSTLPILNVGGDEKAKPS